MAPRRGMFTNHYERCNNPVNDDAEAELDPYFPLLEDFVQLLVLDLA